MTPRRVSTHIAPAPSAGLLAGLPLHSARAAASPIHLAMEGDGPDALGPCRAACRHALQAPPAAQ